MLLLDYQIVDYIECVVFGDVSGDGSCNAADINIIKKYLNGEITVSNEYGYVQPTGYVRKSQIVAGVSSSRDTNHSVNAATVNDIKKWMNRTDETKYEATVDFNLSHLMESSSS